MHDLDVIERACQALGWKLKRGQKHFKWFNSFVGDSPIPRHLFTDEELTKIDAMSHREQCEFMTNFLNKTECVGAIEVPGCNYEIGLMPLKGQLIPVWDWWDAGLRAALGSTDESNPLAQEYSCAAIKQEAENSGFTWECETLPNGNKAITVNTGY